MKGLGSSKMVTRLAIAMLASLAFSLCCRASEGPETGARYITIKPIYISVVFESLNNRHISKQTARGYLQLVRTYKTSWIAFQDEVPADTIIEILGPAPKVWRLPFMADRYFVRLDPDLSRGLDVVLTLDRTFEGNLDGLNPAIFTRYNEGK